MATRSDVLRGRTALVTGASGGIGAACARGLAAAGARVAVNGRRASLLDALASEIAGLAIAGDLGREDGAAAIAEQTAARFGGAPDILVNAAGAFRLAPIAETDAADFAEHLAINVTAPFLLLRSFLPEMLRRSSGHVVSIGSIAGRLAFPNNGSYSASKFALRGLHGVLDAELRGSGVRATLIEPAATDTELWAQIDREKYAALPVPARMLSSGDVADAVMFALTRPRDVAVGNLLLERA